MRLLYHVTIRANIENSCRDLRIAKKTHLDKKKKLYEIEINKREVKKI